MEFSHIDGEGKMRMVDVSGKDIVRRTAVARGCVFLTGETAELVGKGLLKKGDPLSCARVAGIMAAKRTGDLIPLCHPLPIDVVNIEFDISSDRIDVESTVVSTARTGVEMEALTAVSIAALTIYDMCKAVDKGMRIGEISLVSKKKEDLR